MRRLRDSGRLEGIRAQKRLNRARKSAAGKRGDFGAALKDEPSLQHLKVGKEGARKMAALVEGEVGRGPLFDDLVPEADPRRAFMDLIADRISRSATGGIDRAYSEVQKARWEFLTPGARSRAMAQQSKANRGPSKVGRYLDALRAVAGEQVFGADGVPALGAEISLDDEEELIGLVERVMRRCRELTAAFPPQGAAAVRIRGYAKLLDADLARTLGTGGSGQSPRAGGLRRGRTEKSRTGAANRTILSFPEPTEAPLRELVADNGETRDGCARSSFDGHSASVPSPSLALWAIESYSGPGSGVLDPFAGGPTRPVVAAMAGRSYTGTELRPGQAAVTNARLQNLGLSNGAQVHVADAARFDWSAALGGDQAQLILACPPYFDLERYSRDPADLSNCATYDHFCEGIRRVLDALRPALAPGAVSVWIVGEVRDRRSGRILRLPSDIRAIHEDAGFDAFERSITFRRNQRPRSEGREAALGRLVGVDESVVVCRLPVPPR